MNALTRRSCAVLFLVALSCPAATHYVDVGGTNPVPPYSDWGTAATGIMDAVWVAATGATIIVADGLYNAGTGVVVRGTQTRVSVPSDVFIVSVNGPEATTISGSGSLRAVHLGTNAGMSGFSLYAGLAENFSGSWDGMCGGGAYGEPGAVISNCLVYGNRAGGQGGGVYGGTIRHSVVGTNLCSGNGGGCEDAVVENCRVIRNSCAGDGGGVRNCAVRNSLLAGNSAAASGGGSAGGTLDNCTLAGNSVWTPSRGGGNIGGVLINCIVVTNYAHDQFDPIYYQENNYSGAIFSYSCSVPMPDGAGNITNHPLFVDAGSFDYHLQSNSPCINAGSNQAWMAGATDLDGQPRVMGSRVDMGCYERVEAVHAPPWILGPMPVLPYASEVYRTTNASVWVWGVKDPSCWVGARQDGGAFSTGGISQVYEETAWSNLVTLAWTQVVQTIRFDYQCATNAGLFDPEGSVTRLEFKNVGLPSVMITSPAATVGYDVTSAVLSGGHNEHVIGTMWVSNAAKGEARGFAASAAPPYEWVAPAIGLTAGANPIHVTGSNAAGEIAFDVVVMTRETGTGVVRYVSVACANPVPPFSDWATAATSIQDAVSWSVPGDTVLVGDGLYQSWTGTFIRGSPTCVVITNGLVVQSAEGPAGAIISGRDCMRAVYVGSGARLSGFTVRGGSVGSDPDPDGACGGGSYAEPDGVLDNCVIQNNLARDAGGGVYGGIVRNSVIENNLSSSVGGGAGMATLYNCIVRGNGAPGSGGGLEKGEAVNCVFHNNRAGPGSNGGGANDSVVRGCTVVTNTCDWDGGGVSGGRVENSIVYHNYRDHGGVRFENNLSCTDVVYTCTTPNPGGVGNITNHPLFVDAGSFDYHLQSNSPCINAGSNQAWMAGTRDMDGQGRILYGVADMGADEYGYDPEGFGMYPLPAGMATEWVGVSNLTYRFQYCDDVAAGLWTDVDAVFTGTVPVLTVTDTNPAARRFYRVIRLDP